VLILAATPIGNLGDASPRLREAIATAGFVACEDTRSFRQLCGALGVETHAKLLSLHDHNERSRLEEIVALADSHDVLLVSDAGIPTISDPGYTLVSACSESGVEVSIIPGPSAAISALAISGLPTDRFCFEGFLPRKAGERGAALQALREEKRTMIFYEAPHRIQQSLEAMLEVLGDRKAAVVRELTKKFEQTARGSLSELVEWAKGEPKGEMVIVVAGAAGSEFDYAELGRRALELAAEGLGLKQAASDLAAATGASKSVIYEHALRLKP
jgi:16S rRNA (cytidine1402-2'-O)-methyltransferase